MLQINNNSDSKIVLINSIPRTGNIFLTVLLKDYARANNLSNLLPVMCNHNYNLLSVDHPDILNILIIRDPVEIAKSLYLFSKNDYKHNYGHILSLQTTNLLMDNFYKNFFIGPNNYAIMFEDLKNNPLKVLKNIINKINIKYNEEYTFDMNMLEKQDNRSNDIYKSSFPRNLQQNMDYEEVNKQINSEYIEIEKLLIKHESFINLLKDSNKILV